MLQCPEGALEVVELERRIQQLEEHQKGSPMRSL
jgi:hypothetical protein